MRHSKVLVVLLISLLVLSFQVRAEGEEDKVFSVMLYPIGLALGYYSTELEYRFAPNMSIPLEIKYLDLDIGGVSNIIQDSWKYKIIKLKGKRGGEHKKISSVKDMIKQILVKRNFDNWLKEYINKLRTVSQIDINKKVVNELRKWYNNQVDSLKAEG